MNQENEAVSLSPAERKALRANAHHLKPVVMIGDAGLSESVLAETQRALLAHGLIKIRVLGDDRARREALMRELCTVLACAPVQMIGKLLVVYRPRDGVDEGGTPSASALRRRRGPHRPKKALGARTESGGGKAGPQRALAPSKRKSAAARPEKSASRRPAKSSSPRSAKPPSARPAKTASVRPAKAGSERPARSSSAGSAKTGSTRPARPTSPRRAQSTPTRLEDETRGSPKVSSSRVRSGIRSLIVDPDADRSTGGRGTRPATQASKRGTGAAQVPQRDRAPAKPTSIKRGITMISTGKKSLSDKTAGKRTDLHSTEKPPAKKGQPTEASQGPAHLQGKAGPRTGGRRDRAKGGKG